MRQELIKFPKCMNYDCENRLTQYEVSRLLTTKTFSYFGMHFCRSCRSRLNFITDYKCIACGKKFHSLTHLRYRCDECREERYKARKKCKMCSKLLPAHKSSYCSKPCQLKGKAIQAKQYKEKKLAR